MASQPNLPTPHQTNYMGVPVPLLPQVQSIITPPATDATTSSSDFFMINTQSGDTKRIELDIVFEVLIRERSLPSIVDQRPDRNSETQEDPKTKLSQRRKELSRMFLKLAARAAESDETYFMAVSIAEQLAEDVKKSLGKRFDPDLDSSTHTQGTQQQDEAIKPRGNKVKEKEVCGSERPIGGFEKATRQRKKTKNDPKASDSAMKANTSSASGFEKTTRKRKKKP
ncbi:protein FAR1-RELATED SEQUENCE 7-like [Panicum miliaceum]|uniref:Protein FAR1-RELATED SEQUENCE 7-like n=1 Tax=Panicum miliaceum TaxID=4540 RepID=A0A3L6QLQ5_PANMI|nr:protein FAR1-RELATED SEQUENCE 7-like [Panicum miliaceum]